MFSGVNFPKWRIFLDGNFQLIGQGLVQIENKFEDVQMQQIREQQTVFEKKLN